MKKYRAKPIRISPYGEECFFGYYDKSPWNRSEDKLLACMTHVRGRGPRTNDVLRIGYFDLESDQEFQLVGETTAWNFQQGAMAQWINNGGEYILFNVRKQNNAFGCLCSPEGRVVAELAFPVYAVAPDGRLVASVDFGRLACLRPGYGYLNVASELTDDAAPEADGLVIADLYKDDVRLVVSYAELAEAIAPRGSGAHHWIDHIEFNVNGSRLVFLHRWLAADNAPLTRVMAIDSDGGNLRCLLDCGAAGHGLWLDERHYGVWGRYGRVASKIRATTSKASAPLRAGVGIARKLLPEYLKKRINQEEFIILDTHGTSQTTAVTQIPFSARGGHPSLHPGRPWIVSDSLPDRRGQRCLYLASLDGRNMFTIANLLHDPKSANSEYRCDLHPRWDRHGRKVCIDSLHEGYRAIYVVDTTAYFEERSELAA